MTTKQRVISHGLSILVALALVMIVWMGYTIITEGMERSAKISQCYAHGFPDWIEHRDAFYCVRRVNNSDQMVNVSSLTR